MHSCLTLRKDTYRPVWGSSVIQLVKAAHDRVSTPGQQREVTWFKSQFQNIDLEIKR